MCLSTHKDIYQINVKKKLYIKKEEKAWRCEALKNIYINPAWLIVTLVIHQPPLGVCVSDFCHLTSWQQGGA